MVTNLEEEEDKGEESKEWLLEQNLFRSWNKQSNCLNGKQLDMGTQLIQRLMPSSQYLLTEFKGKLVKRRTLGNQREKAKYDQPGFHLFIHSLIHTFIHLSIYQQNILSAVSELPSSRAPFPLFPV